MTDYARNRNLSLKEKFKLKYEEKKKQPPKFLAWAPDAWQCDKISQVSYIFVMTGLIGWGVFDAIPFLYSDLSDFTGLAAQCFGVLCFCETMGNWLCLRMVKSTYNPFIHGTMPVGLKEGEHISKLDKGSNSSSNTMNGHSVTLGIDRNSQLEEVNVVYIATEMPKSATEPPKRAAFPYWSWAPCIRCNRARPPRCHHCPVCNVCVLKRDHHCFFAGTCVGYRNLRYFITFIFWALIGCSYAAAHFVPYFFLRFWPDLSYADIILPVTIVRVVFGYIHWLNLVLVSLIYSLIFFIPLTFSFLQEIVVWVKDGTTRFEKTLKLKVYDTRSLSEKIRSVFGYYWALDFLFPFMHFIYEPIEDPINWPYIKA